MSGAKYSVVITADTIVEIDKIVLEKPIDDNDAFRMLKMLSGKQQYVHTACHLYVKNGSTSKSKSFIETSSVKFTDLTDADIKAYIETGEGRDKSGKLLLDLLKCDVFLD